MTTTARTEIIELTGTDGVIYGKLINGVLQVRRRSHGKTEQYVTSVLHLVRLAYGEKAYIAFGQEEDETTRKGV